MAGGDHSGATMRRYDRAMAEFERAGGYAWRSRLEAIARGLGFTPEDLERPLDTFSGGELTRASLTRALAGEPDVLLLDEPTNHLDVDSIEWLEEYLDGLDAAVMFVSHDRWFLESVASAVLELDRGKGRLTKGSYSHWRRGAGRAAGGPGRPVRAAAGGARPPPALRRPLPLRHQVAPGAEQAEGDGADRAGRQAGRAARAAVRLPGPAAQRPAGAGGQRGLGRGGRQACWWTARTSRSSAASGWR